MGGGRSVGCLETPQTGHASPHRRPGTGSGQACPRTTSQLISRLCSKSIRVTQTVALHNGKKRQCVGKIGWKTDPNFDFTSTLYFCLFLKATYTNIWKWWPSEASRGGVKWFDYLIKEGKVLYIVKYSINQTILCLNSLCKRSSCVALEELCWVF